MALRGRRGKFHTSYFTAGPSFKVALFRNIETDGIEHMNSVQIREILTERWAMSAYPWNLSPHVIRRILENRDNYCIDSVVEPDEDEQVQ